MDAIVHIILKDALYEHDTTPVPDLGTFAIQCRNLQLLN